MGDSFYFPCDGRLHTWIPALSLEAKFATESGIFYRIILYDKHGDGAEAASEGMILGEMPNNVISLVLAGSKTSATTLCGFRICFLAAPRPVMQRLVQEVRSSFKSGGEITPLSVDQLPSLGAVLGAVFRKTFAVQPVCRDSSLIGEGQSSVAIPFLKTEVNSTS